MRRSARKTKSPQQWWKMVSSTKYTGEKRKIMEEVSPSSKSKKSKVLSCLNEISSSMNAAQNLRSKITKKIVKNVQRVRKTKAEDALRQARKDLDALEKKHDAMRRKYEKEIKTLNAKLKNTSSKDSGKVHHKNSLASVFTNSEVSEIQTQFESLTGLRVEVDKDASHKLCCTVLNRNAKKGVKFVISLPDESEPGCQYIPRANCHLLPKHLQCSLEFNVEDAPGIVSEIIGEIFA
jgi:hypothetical protein